MTTTDETTTSELHSEFVASVFPHVDMTQQELAPLLATTTRRAYDRKFFMLRAGESWRNLFYIQRGLIRLFYLDPDGREFNKAFFAEGQAIWPVAPHDRQRAVLFNVAAVEATVVLECPFAGLYDFLRRSGQWEQFALPYAETLVEQKFRREDDLLLLSATERLERYSAAQPHIVRRLPDYHLASFLGITAVSLSRIRRAAID